MSLAKPLVFGLVSLTGLAFLTFGIAIPTLALEDTKSVDVSVLIEPALELSQSNCNPTTNPNKNLLTLTVSPTSPFASDCHNLSIQTNTPGYELLIKAEATNANYNSGTTTNNLLYTDSLPPSPFPTIPAVPTTTNSLSSPGILSSTIPSTVNTWGFAAISNNVNLTSQPIANFQAYASYAANNTTNTYANLPVTNTSLYHSTTFPNQTDDFTFYYATLIDAFTVPGHYGAKVTYSIVAEDVLCPWDSDLLYDDVGCVEPPPVSSMQDFTVSDCDNMALNEIITLPDARDGKEYNIIKLKMSSDGTNDKCWMQQNLAIAGKTLTPADSNVASNFTLPALVSSTSTSGAPTPNTYGVTNPATTTYNMPANSGYLYNWATAIAYDSAVYGGSDSQVLSTNGTIAQYSICPKGWRLPVGGAYTSGSTTGNEFALVDVNSYGGTGGNRLDATTLAKWRNASGFAAVYAGYFRNGFFDDQSSLAGFWSSSVNSGTNAYDLGFESSGMYPQGDSTKNYGISVRCVFGG